MTEELTVTYPEHTCVVTGCERDVMRSERCVYSRCEAHVRALLTGAFGPSPLDPPSSPRSDAASPRAARLPSRARQGATRRPQLEPAG